MSKKYEREQKVVERLEKENRELKSENRTLRRKLRELSKGYYKYMVAEDEEQQLEALQKVQEVAEKVCWDCQGTYKLIVIANRRFRRCNDCGKQGKVTIVE